MAAPRTRRERQVRRRASAARKAPVCWSWDISQEALAAAYRARTTEDAFNVLMEWQLGRCAICGVHDQEICLDHDHETDLIRGILCSSCNLQEGRVDYRAIVKYRHINPAYLLDMRIRYRGRGDRDFRRPQRPRSAA